MGCGCLVVVKNKMLEGLMWEVAGVFLELSDSHEQYPCIIFPEAFH